LKDLKRLKKITELTEGLLLSIRTKCLFALFSSLERVKTPCCKTELLKVRSEEGCLIERLFLA